MTAWNVPTINTKKTHNMVARDHFPYYAEGYLVYYNGQEFFVWKDTLGWKLHEKWTGIQISPGSYNTRKEAVNDEIAFIETQGGLTELNKRLKGYEISGKEKVSAKIS